MTELGGIEHYSTEIAALKKVSESEERKKHLEAYSDTYMDLIETAILMPERKPKEKEEKGQVDFDFPDMRTAYSPEGHRVSIQMRGPDNKEPKKDVIIDGKTVDKVLARVWVTEELNEDGSGKQILYAFSEKGKVYKTEYSKSKLDEVTNTRTWSEGTKTVELDQEETDDVRVNLINQLSRDKVSSADQSPSKKKKPQT